MAQSRSARGLPYFSRAFVLLSKVVKSRGPHAGAGSADVFAALELMSKDEILGESLYW
jgi:hypothetical protein